jgi:hypothetical protein
MITLADNPFAVLTAVVAPAVLTNAYSVLALGTSNRFARVIDRSRVVAQMPAHAPGGAGHAAQLRQLELLRVRAQMLLRALRLFYAALGSFASAAFISVIGSAFAALAIGVAFRTAAALGLAIGAVGVTALVVGCVLMVRETRLALQSIAEEPEIAALMDPEAP